MIVLNKISCQIKYLNHFRKCATERVYVMNSSVFNIYKSSTTIPFRRISWISSHNYLTASIWKTADRHIVHTKVCKYRERAQKVLEESAFAMPLIVFGVVLQHPPNREAPASFHFLTYDTKSSPIIPSDFCKHQHNRLNFSKINRTKRESVYQYKGTKS